MAGPQFSPERIAYGGSLPSPNDNDGRFPIRVGGGLRGKTGLRCLVRQVPRLAHKRPGVESGSSSSHSLFSILDTLSCHRQDGQHGGGVSHQSQIKLPHPWPDMKLYAFPPVKLIPVALCRVKTCGVRLLLVVPFWPSQTWFSEFVSLLEGDPWEILVRKDLLCQLQGRIWHLCPEIW